MEYYLTTTVSLSFEQAIEKVIEELSKVGFGIITEIDVKATMKKKLNVDFKNYKILGACNPHFAHAALQLEDKIGVLLPCNVTVIEQATGHTEVSTINPLTMPDLINNQELEEYAAEIKDRLDTVLANLS